MPTTYSIGADGRAETMTDGFNELLVEPPMIAPILHTDADTVWRLSYSVSNMAVPMPVCFGGPGGYAGQGVVNFTGPYTSADQCNGCATPCSHFWCSANRANGMAAGGPCGNGLGDHDVPPSAFSPPPAMMQPFPAPPVCTWDASAPPRFMPFTVEVYALGTAAGPDLARVQQAMVVGQWMLQGSEVHKYLVFNLTAGSGGVPTLSVSKAFVPVRDVPLPQQRFAPLPIIQGLVLHTNVGASLNSTLYNFAAMPSNVFATYAACFGMLAVNTTLLAIDSLPS